MTQNKVVSLLNRWLSNQKEPIDWHSERDWGEGGGGGRVGEWGKSGGGVVVHTNVNILPLMFVCI